MYIRVTLRPGTLNERRDQILLAAGCGVIETRNGTVAKVRGDADLDAVLVKLRANDEVEDASLDTPNTA